MKRDSRGLAVSTNDDAVVAAADLFRDQILAIGPRISAILSAADEHPESVLLQALAATLGLYGQDRAGAELAERYLMRAQSAPAGNEREMLYLEATRSGASGDIESAASGLEAITERWPRDLVAAKVCEFHYYQMGQHWTVRASSPTWSASPATTPTTATSSPCRPLRTSSPASACARSNWRAGPST